MRTIHVLEKSMLNKTTNENERHLTKRAKQLILYIYSSQRLEKCTSVFLVLISWRETIHHFCTQKMSKKSKSNGGTGQPPQKKFRYFFCLNPCSQFHSSCTGGDFINLVETSTTPSCSKVKGSYFPTS